MAVFWSKTVAMVGSLPDATSDSSSESTLAKDEYINSTNQPDVLLNNDYTT